MVNCSLLNKQRFSLVLVKITDKTLRASTKLKYLAVNHLTIADPLMLTKKKHAQLLSIIFILFEYFSALLQYSANSIETFMLQRTEFSFGVITTLWNLYWKIAISINMKSKLNVAPAYWIIKKINSFWWISLKIQKAKEKK